MRQKTKEGEDGDMDNKKETKGGKLALSKKICTALVPSFCVTEPQAKEFIDKLYKHIGDGSVVRSENIWH